MAGPEGDIPIPQIAAPEPIQPAAANIVFQVPNMNPTLHVKLSKNNFIFWKLQIDAYLHGQDTHGFIDGTNRAPPQTVPNPAPAMGAPVNIMNPAYVTWYQRDHIPQRQNIL